MFEHWGDPAMDPFTSTQIETLLAEIQLAATIRLKQAAVISHQGKQIAALVGRTGALEAALRDAGVPVPPLVPEPAAASTGPAPA